VNEEGPPMTLSRSPSGDEGYRGEDGETDSAVMVEEVSSGMFV
jgi:hypothetical protein